MSTQKDKLTIASNGTTPIPPSLQAKMAALAIRNSPILQDPMPSIRSANSYGPAPCKGRPQPSPRRLKPNFSLKDIDPSLIPAPSPIQSSALRAAGLGAGRPSLHELPKRPPAATNPFSNFDKIVDASGALNFNGKAILHAAGVNFTSGASFAINMDQLQLEDELGKGNYGTVKRVLHKPTNVAMAMKEIRLELDEAKLNAIIMELDILHRAVAPEIVEFYGAFFIDTCVYYCMEYMDAGSLDKLYPYTNDPPPASDKDNPLGGVPEDVLGRIGGSIVRGLKFLKDDLQIIHRDVKPTNILVNRKGQIKLCDFGVSGQLEKSLAKTNIGCQSYMAPERIKGESQNNPGTYTVSSDVWSLGLSMIELAFGRYPYPPETYSNVFAQLTAIVHGDPPELPDDRYSEDARDWVARCLHKRPEMRATYAELLEHPFLVRDRETEVDMGGWVERAIKRREEALKKKSTGAAGQQGQGAQGAQKQPEEPQSV